MTVRSGPEGVPLAPGLSAIMNERRRLIDLAGRPMRSLAETGDASRIYLHMPGSARTRREHYEGEWNGERSSATDAAERVAFVLHNVFPSAQITDRAPAACHQSASSSRKGAA